MVSKVKECKTSLKVLIPFRILSILFLIASVASLLVSLSSPFGVRLFVYVTYVVMYVILAFGFWKMRKWTITLMGLTAVALIVNGGIVALQGLQSIKSIVPLLFVGITLLFIYLSRDYLNGKLGDMRVVRVFVVALILSKILFIL